MCAAAELWDAIATNGAPSNARELLARHTTERMAGAPFHLTASGDGDDSGMVLRCRPTLLIDAI